MGISRLIKKLLDSKVEKYGGVNVISYEKVKENFPDGTMKKYYKKSIKMLMEYASKNNNKLPTQEEWNKFAKENDCLSSESLKFMGNIQLYK